MNIFHYPQERRRCFFFNIFLGVMILSFFVLLKDTTIRQNVINGWFDFYISFRSSAQTDTRRAAEQLAFLDFDQEAWETLGRPGMMPRDKVADLVRAAYDGGAKVIVLDMDYSEADYTPPRQIAGDTEPLSGEARDQALYRVLREIQENPNGPVVLLPALTYTDGVRKENIFSSLYDGRKVLAVTPTFSINQTSDRKVRFWSPYLLAEGGADRQKEILWSIPVAGAAALAGRTETLAEKSRALMEEEASSVAMPSVGGEYVIHRERQGKKGLVRDTQDLQYNRIQYTLYPPGVKKRKPEGNIPAASLAHWRETGMDNPQFDCQGKIVIIGRSDQDSGDFFATPIGNLPGMYVHANSIATVLGQQKPHLTPLYKHVLVELCLILLTAYAFLVLKPWQAKCLVLVLTAACWLASYAYFCLTDEFVYLCFAFTSIGIYDFVNKIETFFQKGVALKEKIRRC